MLVRAPEALRKFTVVRRPMSEPRSISVSCSLETGGEEFPSFICKKGAEVENVFLHCIWVGRGCVAAFTVLVLVCDVEPMEVVCVESVHSV